MFILRIYLKERNERLIRSFCILEKLKDRSIAKVSLLGNTRLRAVLRLYHSILSKIFVIEFPA